MIDPIILDMGTSNIRVRHRVSGTFRTIPTVIAVNTRTGKILALGERAEAMLGRAPAGVRVCRPIRESVVADYDLAVLLLQEVLREASGAGLWQHPTVLASIPYGITEVEHRALEDVICDAGARQARLIPAPLAAAYGTGMTGADTRGRLLVDVGSGTTECAVISYGGIVTGQTSSYAGDAFDRAIMTYLKEKYSLLIGESVATAIKHEIGTAHPSQDRGSFKVYGRNIETGLASGYEITSAEMFEAFRPVLAPMLKQVQEVLRAAPPELGADISADGLTLCGSGAHLPGLAKALANGLGLRVTTARNCDESVVRGLFRIYTDHVSVGKKITARAMNR